MFCHFETPSSNGLGEKGQLILSNILIWESSKKGWRGGFGESIYGGKNLKQIKEHILSFWNT